MLGQQIEPEPGLAQQGRNDPELQNRRAAQGQRNGGNERIEAEVNACLADHAARRHGREIGLVDLAGRMAQNAHYMGPPHG